MYIQIIFYFYTILIYIIFHFQGSNDWYKLIENRSVHKCDCLRCNEGRIKTRISSRKLHTISSNFMFFPNGINIACAPVMNSQFIASYCAKQRRIKNTVSNVSKSFKLWKSCRSYLAKNVYQQIYINKKGYPHF